MRGGLIVVAAGALFLAAPAAAQSPQPPPDDSAVSQYVEAVPSAAGPTAPGVDGIAGSAALPPAVAARLRAEGGADARVLERFATTPVLGAPGRHGAKSRSVPPPDDAPSAAGALGAAVTAVGDTDEPRLLVLALALVAITAAALVASSRRLRA